MYLFHSSISRQTSVFSFFQKFFTPWFSFSVWLEVPGSRISLLHSILYQAFIISSRGYYSPIIFKSNFFTNDFQNIETVYWWMYLWGIVLFARELKKTGKIMWWNNREECYPACQAAPPHLYLGAGCLSEFAPAKLAVLTSFSTFLIFTFLNVTVNNLHLFSAVPLWI